MNNRLNTQELAELISQYTSKDKKEVEAFLREFVALVVDGVCQDKVVKVKGLGTFKLILVEKRESIHVNTGERFLIPAHYKFSFLPDKDLRDQVNKPFSVFETTEIGDNVDFSSLQESDFREESGEEESVEEVMPDREIPLEPVAPDTSGTLSGESSVEVPPVAGPAPKEEEPIPVEETSGQAVDAGGEPRRHSSWGRYVAVILLLLACGVGAAYWFSRPVPTAPGDASPSRGEELAVAVLDSLPVPVDTVADSLAVASAAEPEPITVIDSVTIRHGDRLTAIAQRYYGHKIFWGYIYQFNDSIIDDPNDVPIGTVLRIPSPKLYGIDATDQESRRRAAELQTEILTR